MTVVTELKALTLTANAKAVVQKTTGADIGALVLQGILQANELKKTLNQIIAVHPTGGGDASNLASLTTIAGELA